MWRRPPARRRFPLSPIPPVAPTFSPPQASSLSPRSERRAGISIPFGESGLRWLVIAVADVDLGIAGGQARGGGAQSAARQGRGLRLGIGDACDCSPGEKKGSPPFLHSRSTGTAFALWENCPTQLDPQPRFTGRFLCTARLRSRLAQTCFPVYIIRCPPVYSAASSAEIVIEAGSVRTLSPGFPSDAAVRAFFVGRLSFSGDAPRRGWVGPYTLTFSTTIPELRTAARW